MLLNQGKLFNIFEYRQFTDYIFEPPITKLQGTVLCVGTCDLRTIKPKSRTIHTWYDRLNSDVDCDVIAALAPIDLIKKSIFDYVKVNTKCKKVFMTLPIHHYAEMVDNKIMNVTKNSARVIRYLLAKKVIDDTEYARLLEVVERCKMITSTESVEYFVSNINEISQRLADSGIEYYWTANGTKSANDFFRPIINEIVEKTNLNYVGWIENVDVQVDSSIDIATQTKIYETFVKYLNDKT